MKFEYYQDKEGNAYELKTDLEQLLVHDIFEQDKEIERLNKKLEDINKKLTSINEKVKRLESIIERKERDNELMRKIESQRTMLNGRNIIDGRFYG